MQPWLSMILPGRASLQKQVGSVQANVVSVTLPKIGYAERGDVSIILSLMGEEGQTQIPLYGCVMRVMEDSTDTIIDEEKVIPSLAELLAQFDACKAAASAANTAAGKAISAASAADVAAKAANTQASAAQNAAELAGKAATNAQNAADRIDGMTATAASLSADEARRRIWSKRGITTSWNWAFRRGGRAIPGNAQDQAERRDGRTGNGCEGGAERHTGGTADYADDSARRYGQSGKSEHQWQATGCRWNGDACTRRCGGL